MIPGSANGQSHYRASGRSQKQANAVRRPISLGNRRPWMALRSDSDQYQSTATRYTRYSTPPAVSVVATLVTTDALVPHELAWNTIAPPARTAAHLRSILRFMLPSIRCDRAFKYA